MKNIKKNISKLMMNFTNYLILSLLIFGFIFLTGDSYGQENKENTKPEFLPILLDPNLKIELAMKGLDFPTKMTFIDDETILVGQKYDGKVLVIKNFELEEKPALDLNVDGYLERGLVGLESTYYQGKHFVFVYYTESLSNEDTVKIPKNANNGAKLVRYTWNGESLEDPVTLLHPIKEAYREHLGGAMTVHDDNIYLLIGDNAASSILTNNSEKPHSYDHGVIIGLTFNGEPADSNPFTEPEFSNYYAYGIRNGYGLTVDPVTNRMWDTENGPETGDELNLLFPGFNSGWNKVIGPSWISKYADVSNLSIIEGSEYSEPEFSWLNSDGITEIEFLKSERFGDDYKNTVFVGNVFGKMYHLELNQNRDGFYFTDSVLADSVADNPKELEEIVFAKNLGIITDIDTGPDGFLYVLSMVHSDVPGWLTWKGGGDSGPVEKKGPLSGVIFRIAPDTGTQDTVALDTDLPVTEIPTTEKPVIEMQDTGAESFSPENGEDVEEGGGCLIATATYGSELSNHVQSLRELRDNKLLQTNSGSTFMMGFNNFYYTLSPTIADWERQNTAFKEIVKLAITPLLYSLSILNYINIDSEEEVLGYGIGIILLNVGMYFIAPAILIQKLKKWGS